MSARVVAAAVVLACTLPFVTSEYRLFQLTMVLVYAIALLGLNLLTGYNGQISLGHGAFYAIGAYAMAIATMHGGLPWWAAIPLAGLLCGVAGFLFGLPALRLEGPYLALATFGLALAMPQLLKYPSFERWTGGVQGLVLPEPAVPFGLPLSVDQWLYFLALATAIALFTVARNLLRGRIGRAIVAIRDHPIAAQAMGIDTARVKSTTFGVSAAFTGIAGALGALAVRFVAPDGFPIFLSIVFLVGSVIGGVASIQGALWGALFLQFVPNFAGDVSTAAPWAIYGLAMLAFVYLMPSGVAGGVERLRAKLATQRRNRPGAPLSRRST
jgi:branched-chain amino acid transport system permease protein